MAQKTDEEIVRSILIAQGNKGINAAPTRKAVKAYRDAVDAVASSIHSEAAYAAEFDASTRSMSEGW